MPRAWPNRIGLLVAVLALIGAGVFLLLGGEDSFQGQVAAVAVAIVLGFILGNAYELPIARVIVRPMSRWWSTVLAFIAWWVGLLVVMVMVVELLVLPGVDAASAPTTLGTCVLLAALMAVGIPFFPRTSIYTGAVDGKDAFEKLGIRGLRRMIIKGLGFVTLFGTNAFVMMILIAALLEPDFIW